MRKQILLFAGLLLAQLSIAQESSPAPGEKLMGHLEREVRIEPGKFEEPCFPMALADQLQFSFESDAVLDFNIHYHEGKDIFFPVELSAITRYEQNYFAPISHQYCMMWTNRGETPVTLRYQYRLLRRENQQ